MQKRFAMTFDRTTNSSSTLQQQINNNVVQNLTPLSTRNAFSSLSSPMIERVYKSRPGCSACGKKVM